LGFAELVLIVEKHDIITRQVINARHLRIEYMTTPQSARRC
jgi:hypothetical protein